MDDNLWFVFIRLSVWDLIMLFFVVGSFVMVFFWEGGGSNICNFLLFRNMKIVWIWYLFVWFCIVLEFDYFFCWLECYICVVFWYYCVYVWRFCLICFGVLYMIVLFWIFWFLCRCGEIFWWLFGFFV